MSELSGLGLIETQDNRGGRVSPNCRRFLLDALELREALDGSRPVAAAIALPGPTYVVSPRLPTRYIAWGVRIRCENRHCSTVPFISD